MKILVCGGRDYDKHKRIASVLGLFDELDPIIIHGAAKGADTLAAKWAQWKGFKAIAFPADWEKNGKAAGPIRNQQMLDEGKPDVVVAFGGNRGTNDMVRRAKAAEIPVIEVDRS
jgi:hypothetical protein